MRHFTSHTADLELGREGRWRQNSPADRDRSKEAALSTLLHYNTVTLEHSGSGLLLCGAVTKTGIEMFSFYGNLAASLALVTL